MSRPAAVVTAALGLALCSCPGSAPEPQRGVASPWAERPTSGGLSTNEAWPDTPDHVALLPNPALVDGDQVASAGVNLGFGSSVAGDLAFRDVGARLADPAATVDLVCVGIDRTLPPSVAAAYAWTVYQSADDLVWSPVAFAAPAAFSAIENRFELPIAATAATFLKAVTRPLPALATSDPAYRDVFVTEVRLFALAAP